MTDIRFIQIHWLASYPAALLNRDDAGLAKRMPFGGTTRARVSSQCLKRHWRYAGAETLEKSTANPWALANLGIPMGVRSKRIVEERIMPALALSDGDTELHEAIQGELLLGLYGKNAKDNKKRQALFFGEPEITFLVGKARDAAASGSAKDAAAALVTFFKDERANIKELVNGAGLESAMFGRMVTSDPAANRDAAIHVAHAMTVHAIERELDFMTAVDDLSSREKGDDGGAAGIFDSELASGVYYGYVVVDWPLLVSNLGGDEHAASKVVESLVHLIAEVSPGAKKGSTAPYACAEFMLVERGSRQPRTLANAFRKAVRPGRDEDVAELAVSRIAAHLSRVDEAYGQAEERLHLSTLETAINGMPRAAMDSLAQFASGAASAARGG